LARHGHAAPDPNPRLGFSQAALNLSGNRCKDGAFELEKYEDFRHQGSPRGSRNSYEPKDLLILFMKNYPPAIKRGNGKSSMDR